ncbi:hypothetical protein CICLE_v10006399mg [Citrus x clementina]|uniref:Uncharacterized protein n=2 Tax=Citrus TaxID=2706 RepID=A0A067FXG1_CITSI|nr:hypothetical protein CICLE_v10006399mg [Citrus x clementina]KDO72043.1 hypothetical protein CISIN_1g035459mg [Citrus sinensis]
MKKRPKILPVKIMHGSKNKKAAAAAARDGLVMASFELGARVSISIAASRSS